MQRFALQFICIVLILVAFDYTSGYDPSDEALKEILPANDTFEPFYPRNEAASTLSRPPHSHGSFFAHRNPALVDVRNAAAYGFRFDGKRRFNFD